MNHRTDRFTPREAQMRNDLFDSFRVLTPRKIGFWERWLIVPLWLFGASLALVLVSLLLLMPYILMAFGIYWLWTH